MALHYDLAVMMWAQSDGQVMLQFLAAVICPRAEIWLLGGLCGWAEVKAGGVEAAVVA